MNLKANQYHPPIVFHPGGTLEEKLEELGMDAQALAEATGLSEAEVSGILKGFVSITPDTAIRLEHVLGIPARFWLKMQEAWDEFHVV
ncbi:MAG: HigA family addiction module antidote protein [Saprospiraceae bacterium]|nr:HigA family addiction module antidote protein [Saprospiraceae bacterium]